MQLKTYTTIFLFFLSYIHIQGQNIDDKVKNRTENEADERVDEKINNGVEKGFDAIEGLFKKKKKKKKHKNKDKKKRSKRQDREQNHEQSMRRQSMQNMFGGGDVDVPDSYEFEGQIITEVSSYKKNGNQQSRDKFAMLLNPENEYMAMRPIETDDHNSGDKEETTMIFDSGNQRLVTLVDNGDQKTGVVMSLDQDKYGDTVADEEAEEAAPTGFTLEKTGNTREILGYSCDEYAFDSKEAKGTLWMTDEIEAGITGFLTAFAKNSKKNYPGFKAYDRLPQGSVMLMNSVDKEDGTRSKMQVTDIDRQRKESIPTANYQMMDMSKMQHQ